MSARRITRRLFRLPKGDDPQFEVWKVRALLLLRKNFGKDYEADSEKSFTIKVLHAFPEYDRRKKKFFTIQELQERLQMLLKAPSRRSAPIFATGLRFCKEVGLSPTEAEIFLLAISMQIREDLNDVVGHLLRRSMDSIEQFSKALAFVLGLPERDVRQALSPDGLLAQKHIVRYAPSNVVKYGFFSDESPLYVPSVLVRAIADAVEPGQSVLSSLLVPCRKPTLTLEDFDYIRDEVDILLRFLKAAIKDKERGHHVLLFGDPGTGKTQLGRILAHTVADKAFEVPEVPMQNWASEEQVALSRLEGYKLVQGLAPKENCLIIFDEAETVFVHHYIGLVHGGKPATDKAATNFMLENSPITTIWISNTVGLMDEAYLRRFDLVIKLKIPPLKVRRRILEQNLGGLSCSEEVKKEILQEPFLSPADLSRMATVANMVEPKDQSETDKVLRTLLKIETGEDDEEDQRRRPRHDPQDYDLSLVNCKFDLGKIIERLKERGDKPAKILLYGPSGTGKTAFVHKVAYELKKRLITKTASDLLGPYVGQTEAAIAHMFREAKEENAILFLDEADSLLRDRKLAFHTWEVTQVNELLARMEDFDGILFCATNLVHSLDRAVFKRFDLSLEFRPLRTRDRIKMFEGLLTFLGRDPKEVEMVRGDLERMEGLTIGDFAQLRRKLDLVGLDMDARALITELRAEMALKGQENI